MNAVNTAHAGPAAGPPATRPWRALIAVLPFLVAVAAVAAVFGAVRDRLPEPLAVHFAADGTSDDFATAADFLTFALGLPVVFGAVIGVLVLRDAVEGALRWVIATGYGLAGLYGCMGVLTLLENAETGDAATVRLPMSHLGPALGVAALAAVVGRLCAGRDRIRADKAAGPAPAAPPLDLGADETAGWSRTVASPALVALGPGLLAAGVVVGLAVNWVGAAGLAFGALICVAFAGVRVTADRRGLTVASSLVPRPRLHIPLARIAEAGVQQISPLGDFGGWGYRLRSGRSGIVLRRGEALALRLAHGRVFVVTVDDAATAAALLNALRDRAHGPGSGPEQGA
ncbi:DUF1648 domain-containing protein [Streptomyces sp. NPDC018019]|uniref:DUF1648 domain-containing protein n=1 Tax=Streptomyces sp. NPDC018019 TaxID=3365030 RepID=UPI0037954DA0